VRYAVNSGGQQIEAEPNLRALCPSCGKAVSSKCGEIISRHWAHITSDDCDTWSESETVWHRSWQEMVPPKQREVIIGTHRADIVAADGTVVELQHSHLPTDDIRAREAHYGRMFWIFDAIAAYEDGRLNVRQRDGYVTFRWKHPRKSISLCRRPVLLDLGVHLLLVKRIHAEAPCGGWGQIVTKAHVARLLDGGPL
jgi:competence protein CoiA